MMETHKDYELFNRTTDIKFTKNVKVAGKPQFTNIDTYWLIEEATKVFGLFGKGWGFKSLDYSTLSIGDTMLLQLQAVFFFKGGEFPIANSTKMSYKTKAGYITVRIRRGDSFAERPREIESVADYVIDSLTEIFDILKSLDE